MGIYLPENRFATTGFVTFLFGIFTAYWAQTTKRSAWLWFFLGLFLAPFTGIALLWKNSNDQAKSGA
jgi:hypothetical protein